jgi:hypothetical protein
MTQSLQDIFQLEDTEQFDKAFDAYSDIYSKDKNDYEIWKHFYFFLWTAIEDAPIRMPPPLRFVSITKKNAICCLHTQEDNVK